VLANLGFTKGLIVTDLTALSLDQLKNLQKDIEKAINSFEARRLAHARQELEAKAKELGVSLAEILGSKPAKGAKAAVSAKYRNPKNPEETWSGRGRKPRWLVVAMTSVGAKLDDFLIG
jgi:DNA-binding protein H-NS